MALISVGGVAVARGQTWGSVEWSRELHTRGQSPDHGAKVSRRKELFLTDRAGAGVHGARAVHEA